MRDHIQRLSKRVIDRGGNKHATAEFAEVRRLSFIYGIYLSLLKRNLKVSSTYWEGDALKVNIKNYLHSSSFTITYTLEPTDFYNAHL